MVPLPLTTVRPFIIEELTLKNPSSEDYYIEKAGEQAIEDVKDKILEMIAKALEKHTGESGWNLNRGITS